MTLLVVTFSVTPLQWCLLPLPHSLQVTRFLASTFPLLFQQGIFLVFNPFPQGGQETQLWSGSYSLHILLVFNMNLGSQDRILPAQRVSLGKWSPQRWMCRGWNAGNERGTVVLRWNSEAPAVSDSCPLHKGTWGGKILNEKRASYSPDPKFFTSHLPIHQNWPLQLLLGGGAWCGPAVVQN